MVAIVEKRHEEVQAICAARRVRRLELFGSAARGQFDPASSDLDFLVEFQPMPPADHADCYFGLQADLEQLFGVAVELVEPSAIRNPYFRESVDEARVTIYAAP